MLCHSEPHVGHCAVRLWSSVWPAAVWPAAQIRDYHPVAPLKMRRIHSEWLKVVSNSLSFNDLNLHLKHSYMIKANVTTFHQHFWREKQKRLHKKDLWKGRTVASRQCVGMPWKKTKTRCSWMYHGLEPSNKIARQIMMITTLPEGSMYTMNHDG